MKASRADLEFLRDTATAAMAVLLDRLPKPKRFDFLVRDHVNGLSIMLFLYGNGHSFIVRDLLRPGTGEIAIGRHCRRLIEQMHDLLASTEAAIVEDGN